LNPATASLDAKSVTRYHTAPSARHFDNANGL
jgi:hypothetical protein